MMHGNSTKQLFSLVTTLVVNVLVVVVLVVVVNATAL